MTETFLSWLRQLIQAGDIHPFYVTSEWRALSAAVLREDRRECQICKANGKYRAAVMVHHVNHVKRHPELALSRFYTDHTGQQQRNLISVCRGCHETVCHPERLRKQFRKPSGFINEERWD